MTRNARPIMIMLFLESYPIISLQLGGPAALEVEEATGRLHYWPFLFLGHTTPEELETHTYIHMNASAGEKKEIKKRI